MPDFEDRMERLAEKQQAIAESLELMVHEFRERDALYAARFEALIVRQEETAAHMRAQGKLISANGEHIKLLAERSAEFLSVLMNHEKRIDELEE